MRNYLQVGKYNHTLIGQRHIDYPRVGGFDGALRVREYPLGLASPLPSRSRMGSTPERSSIHFVKRFKIPEDALPRHSLVRLDTSNEL